MNFRSWLEAHQQMFPFATEEPIIDDKFIKRFKSPKSYVKWKVRSGRKTEVAAKQLISTPASNWFVGEEELLELIPNAFIIPEMQFTSVKRPAKPIAFVHLKTIKSANPNNPKYNKPRHRLLAYWNGNTKKDVFEPYNKPIGGVSWIGSDIDVVWIDKEFRKIKPSLYAALMKTARLRGAHPDPKDKLTSKSFRTAQAKYDWKRANR